MEKYNFKSQMSQTKGKPLDVSEVAADSDSGESGKPEENASQRS